MSKDRIDVVLTNGLELTEYTRRYLVDNGIKTNYALKCIKGCFIPAKSKVIFSVKTNYSKI